LIVSHLDNDPSKNNMQFAKGTGFLYSKVRLNKKSRSNFEMKEVNEKRMITIVASKMDE